jgi:hypothetical protein
MTWKEFKAEVDGQLRTLGGDDESKVKLINLDNCPGQLYIHVENDNNTVAIYN